MDAGAQSGGGEAAAAATTTAAAVTATAAAATATAAGGAATTAAAAAAALIHDKALCEIGAERNFFKLIKEPLQNLQITYLRVKLELSH